MDIQMKEDLCPFCKLQSFLSASYKCNKIQFKLLYYKYIYIYMRGRHIILLTINDKIAFLNYTFHS